MAYANTHPVTVVNDDGIGCHKVDPETSGTSTEQEDKHVIITVELGHLQTKTHHSTQTFNNANSERSSKGRRPFAKPRNPSIERVCI